MGNVHVEELRGIPDLLLKFRFDLELSPEIANFSSQDVIEIQKRIVSVSPLFEIVMTHANAPSKNSHWYYMEDDDVSALTFTFTELNDSLTRSYFLAWVDMMINSDGTYNAPKYYKKDVNIKLYKADFVSEVASVQVIGASPGRVSGTELSYEGSDPVNVEVELSFDSLKFSKGGANSTGGTPGGSGNTSSPATRPNPGSSRMLHGLEVRD